jgi:hypothetical protein
MRAGVYQKVLDDAELIALVRQTQDQFEGAKEEKALVRRLLLFFTGRPFRVRKPSSKENQT